MPPPPEDADALRLVGGAEIKGNVDVKELSQAYGHIGIAAEIKIDLEGIGKSRGPGGAEAQTGSGKPGVREKRQGIGNNRLFEQADGEYVRAFCRVVPVPVPPCFVFELGYHLAVEHDGARHQLGEKQHKDAVVVKPLQNLLALADGDQKRELLEGEKADAQRQGNAFQNQGGVE